jgi:hypothetical protein
MATSSEIERRLIEDNMHFVREDLEATLRLMFKDGRLGQTDDDRFYVLDDSPLFVPATAEPPPSWPEIERHTGWEPWDGQMHGRHGGWLDAFPPE